MSSLYEQTKTTQRLYFVERKGSTTFAPYFYKKFGDALEAKLGPEHEIYEITARIVRPDDDGKYRIGV